MRHGIVMQENDTTTKHSSAFVSDSFTAKLKEPELKKHLSKTKLSSDSDVKTAAENWLNGQGRDFYQTGLNKLALRSDKGLNRFGDYVGK
ncbi:hypothetical protein AVEN_213302-1 [Araneus ventricosus]|uniref:Uncharacterized protein n=1 Tax=Araneus ventricosus TaxID=182803 RepID=A0A4Y2HLQ8_ARAVE|nr:hypothetical protein AVEN_213302-1 [Araneus ventricosus]